MTDSNEADGAVALVVVDVQHDYLDRPGLQPGAPALIDSIASLLAVFRRVDAPVAHVHTLVPLDGGGALPHWRRHGQLWCVAGTRGAEAPPEVAPVGDEFVAHKTHYSGFADPGLASWLAARGVRTVAIAGLMEHACVRSTALDAAAAGFDVRIVTDAVATDDPEHASLSRSWLKDRVASTITVADLAEQLASRHTRTPSTEDGAWARPSATSGTHASTGASASATGTAPQAPQAHPARRAAFAAARARTAQRTWAAVPAAERAEAIARWAGIVEANADELARAIAEDVHKPITQATEEVRRTIGHLRSAARLATLPLESLVGADVRVRRRPVGVVALVMPWNNPLALPVAKAGAALAVGNAVVLKPAPQAPQVTDTILTIIRRAGLPDGLIEVVPGGPESAMAVVGAAGIDAVAVTGSIPTGRRLAAECLRLARPIQAELGGNNAAVVLADADLDGEVPALVAGAFAFGGQRCTAIRRAVVERPALERFTSLAATAMDHLLVGDPLDPRTHVGPLISPDAATRVRHIVDAALASGAHLAHQAAHTPPDNRGWFPPTLLLVDDPALPIVTDETFGPVLVIQPADDIDHAIALANGVDQGLLGAVCTSDPAARRRVMDELAVGIVQVGGAPPPIDPDAPFGGWGASGIGPAEHGVWDLDLLTRTQAIYEP